VTATKLHATNLHATNDHRTMLPPIDRIILVNFYKKRLVSRINPSLIQKIILYNTGTLQLNIV